MVFLADGRFELPDNLFYGPKTHIFIDLVKKTLGIDQILTQALKPPIIIKNRVEQVSAPNTSKNPDINDETPTMIMIGDHIADIIHGEDKQLIKIHSPCKAIYKSFNSKAADNLENDTYSLGYLFEFDDILEIEDGLLTGKQIKHWAESEIDRLFDIPTKIKIMLLGDSKVGKTSIKNRYCDDCFSEVYNQTVGVDFGSKKFHFITNRNRNERKIKIDLTLWEVAGDPEMKELIGMYMLDTKGVFLVCDIFDSNSIQNIDSWFEEIEMNIGVRIPIIILINKCEDLHEKIGKNLPNLASLTEHIFKHDEILHPNIDIIKKIMQKHLHKQVPIYLISAKTGEGIEDAFNCMISSILSLNEDEEDDA